MHIRYRVDLEESERQQLEAIVAGGTRAVRRVKRAQILLAAAAGASDAAIATALQVGTATVYRTKQHLVERGLERALSEGPRPGGKRKLVAAEEALLIATACAQPPGGRARWTLALLATVIVRLTRARATVIIGVIGVVLVYLGLLAPTVQAAATAAFIAFAELAAPWATIVGIGFLLTRGRYDADDLQVFNRGRTGGRYWYSGGWSWQAALAWAVGSIVGLLMIQTQLFQGPLANIAAGVGWKIVPTMLLTSASKSISTRVHPALRSIANARRTTSATPGSTSSRPQ